MHSHTFKPHLAEWNFQIYFGFSTGGRAPLCRVGGNPCMAAQNTAIHTHTGLSAASPKDPRQLSYPHPSPSLHSISSPCAALNILIHGRNLLYVLPGVMQDFSNLPEELLRSFCQVTHITLSGSSSVDNGVIF